MRQLKQYPFSLAANGTAVLLVSNDNFKLQSATGAVSIQGDTFGTISPVLPGQGIREVNFSRLVVTDLTGSANIGVLMTSDDAFTDDRIFGDVSVIDGEKSRGIAGGLMAGNPNSPAVVGGWSGAQIWNPSTTGKNLIVTQASAMLSANGAILWWPSAVGVSMGNDISAFRLANKKIGAAVGSAQSRKENYVADPAAAVRFLRADVVLASTPVTWVLKAPIVIPPNYGLNVSCDTANVSLYTNFEWYEESVT